MNEKLLNEIRTAVADYISSEGCSCCEDIEHREHQRRLGELLSVEKYSDDEEKYNFTLYESPEIIEISKDQFVVSGYSYFAKHIPTGENWYIIGISEKYDRVCAAGFPPSMARLSDCTSFEINKPLTKEEIAHRDQHFGKNWS